MGGVDRGYVFSEVFLKIVCEKPGVDIAFYQHFHGDFVPCEFKEYMLRGDELVLAVFCLLVGSVEGFLEFF